MPAHHPGVFPELFFFHHIQHRHADLAAHRTAAGRREEITFRFQCLGDFPTRNHRAQRLAIAHALGHADDVRHHALLFEAPEKVTHAPISDLHFIGDAHPALGPHQRIDLFQITGRQGNPAGVAIHRFTDETGQLALLRGDMRQLRFDAAYIIRRRIQATEFATIEVRRSHRMYPVRTAFQRSRVVGNRRRHRIGADCPAVIGLQHAEHVAAAAVGPRQPDRQVVGLAATVDQKHPVHAFRRQLQQAFGKLRHRRIVEARVGVEQRPLSRRHLRHARMTMAKHCDVVEHVEVGTALHVDQVIAPATLDARRVDVIMFLRAGETGVTSFEQGFGVQLRFGIAGQPQQRGWRRTQRLPCGRARRAAKQRRIQRRNAAQLHLQRAIDRPQHLTFDQRRATVQRGAHTPQAHAELGSVELQHTVRRAMQHTGKRCFHRRTLRHAQLNVQRERLGLDRTVGSRLRQAILSVTARRQTMRGSGFGQQLLINARLLPVARFEVRTQDAKIDQRKFSPDQFRQQRRETFTADGRQRLADCRENRRLHQRQRHRSRYVEDFPLMFKVVAAIGVARIDADLLLATEHQHRRPRHDQRPQRQQLFMLQRIDRVIGLHRRQNHKRITPGMVQQRRARHRQVSDAPGAHQITEVDHALQLPMTLGITLPDGIIVGDVHVDRLHRQLVLQRLQATFGLLGGACDQCALAFIVDHRQQVADQRTGMARVPLQRALQARVIEAGQGQIHLATQPTETGHHVVAQVIKMRQRLTFDVVQQSHVHRLAVGFQRQQIRAIAGRDHPGYVH